MDTAGNVPAPDLVPTTPEELRKEGNRLLNAGRFEEAVHKMSEALQLLTAQVPNELDFSLAQFYYSYGDAILAKLTNSSELFVDELREERPLTHNEEEKKAGKEEEKGVGKEEEKGAAEKEEKEEEKGEGMREAVEDVQVAWESLEAGRVVCEKKLQEDIESEVKREASLILGRIYLGLGEVLAMQEKKEDALIEYEKALKIRKEFSDPNSRELAEVYFNIGSTILMIKGREAEAIKSLSAAARILENCLKAELGNNATEHIKEEVKSKDVIDRELVKVTEADTGKVRELKEVLGNVYDKVLLQPNC